MPSWSKRKIQIKYTFFFFFFPKERKCRSPVPAAKAGQCLRQSYRLLSGKKIHLAGAGLSVEKKLIKDLTGNVRIGGCLLLFVFPVGSLCILIWTQSCIWNQFKRSMKSFEEKSVLTWQLFLEKPVPSSATSSLA